MRPTIKKTFNGVVKKQTVAKGSKSERTAAVLHTGTKRYILNIAGLSSFDISPFEAFFNKQVSIKAEHDPKTGRLFADSVQDIRITPPRKK